VTAEEGWQLSPDCFQKWGLCWKIAKPSAMLVVS
jgi:hypothetical protein